MPRSEPSAGVSDLSGQTLRTAPVHRLAEPHLLATGDGPLWDDDLDFLEVVAVVNATRVHCTGVVVGRRSVLTARHCLPVSEVRFGHDALAPQAVRAVVAAKSPLNPRLDVALLRLGGDVELPLPQVQLRASSDLPAGILRAVGFGSRNRRLNQAYARKRFVEFPLSAWRCDGSRQRGTGCQADLELLLAAHGGTDTCDGDSGGPLYEEHEGRRRLVGVTSRSVEGAKVPCGAGGIYVRLDRLADWLGPALAAQETTTPPSTSP